MRKIVLTLALALALPTWAQTDKAPAATAPAPEKPAAQPEPAKPEAAKAEPRKRMATKHPRRFEDARHCLDEPTNTAIIKCAEAYL